jgi:TonB family protein
MQRFIALLLFALFISPALQAQEKDPPPPPPPPPRVYAGERPKVIRKSGGVLQSQALSKPAPAYPPLAKAADVSGAVVVEVTIDEEGSVIASRALTGHPLLKDAAVNAAKGWKWKPTTLSGTPVKVIGTITFNFTLNHALNDGNIAALEEAARNNPDSAEARFKLGEAYYRTEKTAEAEAELREAIRIDPAYSEAHYKLALTLMVLKRYSESVNEFSEAVRLNPDYAEAFTGLGLSNVELSRYDDAITAFNRPRELAPRVIELYLYLGMTYSAMGRKEDALAAFKEGIKAAPDHAELHYVLGRFYLQEGDKKAAKGKYEILKKLAPALAESLLKDIDQ